MLASIFQAAELKPDSTPLVALLLGLLTSLHCAGMCGPLACGLGALSKSEGERLTAASLYHGGRLTGYAIIGAVCGAIGQQPLKWFFGSHISLLPWLLVAVLLLLAFHLDKHIPRPAVFNRLTARARLRATRLPALGASAAIGLLTPFLPCSPLYGAFFVALAAGSAAKGAELMLAFGLGTVPLLWLAQHQFHRLRAHLSPTTMARTQRALALVAALVLTWRLHGTVPFLHPSPPPEAKQDLPSCCHQ